MVAETKTLSPDAGEARSDVKVCVLSCFTAYERSETARTSWLIVWS